MKKIQKTEKIQKVKKIKTSEKSENKSTSENWENFKKRKIAGSGARGWGWAPTYYKIKSNQGSQPAGTKNSQFKIKGATPFVP